MEISSMTETMIHCPQCGAEIEIGKTSNYECKTKRQCMTKFQKTIVIMSCFVLLFAIVWIILWYIYYHQDWVFKYYRRYSIFDYDALIIVSAIGLLLFMLCFVLMARKSFQKFPHFFRAMTLMFFGLNVCTFLICLGFEIAACVDVDLNYHYTLFKYNSVLAKSQKDSPLYDEALAKFIEDFGSGYGIPFLVQEAAENGNIKAQEKLGLYYYDYGQRYYTYDRNESREEFERHKREALDFYDRSIYWFIKAADQGSPVSQYYVGRFYMGDIQSRQYDVSKAHKYLIKAAKQNYPAAYYYLGLLYKEVNKNTAYNYWKNGAALGDEDCKKAIERPQN